MRKPFRVSSVEFLSLLFSLLCLDTKYAMYRYLKAERRPFSITSEADYFVFHSPYNKVMIELHRKYA